MDHRWMLLLRLCYVFHSAWSCCIEELPLISLNCCNCNFSVVPLDLPKHTTRLDLSFNPLGSLPKNNFFHVAKLEFLDLTRCSITSIDDFAFFGLKSLHTLILTANPVMHWSPLTFSDLSSLHRLVVVETSLTSLSQLSLAQPTSLKELNVGKNMLKSLYLPNYVSSLHVLDLHSNQIADIKENDLENLRNTNLSNFSLILSQNPIDHISPGAFRFISLHMLHLKGCFSNEDLMKSNLNATSGLLVEKIVIGYYRIPYVKNSFKSEHFEGLYEMDVKELTISGIQFASNSFCGFFKNITSLRVTHSNLDVLPSETAPSNLQKLEIKRSLLTHMPSSVISTLKELKEIRITENHKFTTYDYDILVPNLELLDLSRNNLNMERCCLVITNGAPNLQHLNLSYNTMIGISSIFLNMTQLLSLDLKHSEVTSVGVHPVFVLMHKLIYLDLSDTKCQFSIECSFCGLYSVEELKVSKSKFSTNILASVFKNLTKLRLLEMASCELNYIPTEIFADLKLLKTLDLSDNNLLELQESVLSPLISLTMLNMSFNSFQSISKETTTFIAQNLVKVDLSHNPYDCSCHQETFLLWVQEQNSRGFKFSESLKCNTPEYLQGTQLSQVNLNCIMNIYLSLGGFLIAIAIAGGVFHCYKKKYFHLCYLFQKYKAYNTEKEYDAFVIYSSLEEEWVKEQLVPKLEGGTPRFQLCLHYRDFIPGVPITTNIVNEGICRSRKALIILSQNFIESKWCSFEFEMVMSWQFLESQCGIIVILLEAVNMAHLKHMLELSKYLRKNTYLKWSDGYVERMIFWKRLREALQQGDASATCAPQIEDDDGERCEEQNEPMKIIFV